MASKMTGGQKSVPRGTSSKRGGGRPTKYKLKYCQDLIDHMKSGGSIQGFGVYLYEKSDGKDRVCEKTVHEWMKKHPEFLQSARMGLALARKFWDEATTRGTLGQLRRVESEKPVTDSKGNPIIDPHTGKVVMQRQYAPATFAQNFAKTIYHNRFNWSDSIDLNNLGNQQQSAEEVAENMKDPEYLKAMRVIAEKSMKK